MTSLLKLFYFISIFTQSYSFTNHLINFKWNYIPKKTMMNSHFSIVDTKITDKTLLIKSLKDLNISIIEDKNVIIKDSNSNLIETEIGIHQNNGYHMGFVFENNYYNLIGDLQFWEQSIPPSVFIERITKQYSINAVIETSKEEGFTVENFVQDKNTGIIQIELSKYNF